MKRSWNAPIWIGFLVLVAGLFSYHFLLRFPATRDVPWVSLVAIAVAIPFFAVGLARAFREPQRYRGRIGGTIAAVVALGLTGFFLYATLVGVRQIPASKGAPQVGSRAPDFTLPDQDGNPVTLSRVISESKPAAVVLVFYRGFW
ncbi:MAG: redoxin domain-containing protein [Deltaproteobacteria bacterium]|nr:MAG: redoxin domain-containing protein [Deltaproteobacteria bacterium]TMB29827.1 MAG: redoxin domain-containing protein [Deltaproteobacteria bacterium]